MSFGLWKSSVFRLEVDVYPAEQRVAEKMSIPGFRLYASCHGQSVPPILAKSIHLANKQKLLWQSWAGVPVFLLLFIFSFSSVFRQFFVSRSTSTPFFAH